MRPSPNTRRASTSPSSPSGAQLGERRELLVVEEAVRQVELGLDVRLARRGPTAAASPRAPSSSPIACARIVLPAPVSPVIAFSPRVELELGLADQHEVLDRAGYEAKVWP